MEFEFIFRDGRAFTVFIGGDDGLVFDTFDKRGLAFFPRLLPIDLTGCLIPYITDVAACMFTETRQDFIGG